MMIGIAPSTGGDALKIAIGGWIALAVIDYVASEWKKFDWIARLEADGASRWRSFMNWSNSALVLGQNIRVGSGKTEGGSPGRVVLCSPLCPAAFAIRGWSDPLLHDVTGNFQKVPFVSERDLRAPLSIATCNGSARDQRLDVAVNAEVRKRRSGFGSLPQLRLFEN